MALSMGLMKPNYQEATAYRLYHAILEVVSISAMNPMFCESVSKWLDEVIRDSMEEARGNPAKAPVSEVEVLKVIQDHLKICAEESDIFRR